jgi:hypothetical protein
MTNLLNKPKFPVEQSILLQERIKENLRKVGIEI